MEFSQICYSSCHFVIEMPLSQEDSARAIALVHVGFSIREAANSLGFARSSVHRAVLRFRQTGGYTRRPGSGRRRSTSARDNRYITMLSLRNRHMTAVKIRNQLERVREVNVNERTVRRRLGEANLGAYRPATGPELLRGHRVSRLLFAQEHLNWNLEQWKSVLFSDELRFALRSPDGRARVWRRPGERYAPCNFSERLSFNGRSIMVWGGFSWEARTQLVFIERGTLTAHRYIEEVLQDHVVGFAQLAGDGFIFMHDNARPHTARIVTDYLHDVGIDTMNWLARSPDLNPIEHLWDVVGKQVRARRGELVSLQELRRVVQEEWDNTPQEEIQHLIESMPRRLEAVIRARGGNTKY
jgi:transposase